MKRGDGGVFRRKRAGRVLLFAHVWRAGDEDEGVAAAAVVRECQRIGLDVHIITSRDRGQPELERYGNLFIHRAEVPGREVPPALWKAVLNIRLAALGGRVLTKYGSFEKLMAEDDRVFEGASVLAEKARLPLETPSEAFRQRLLSLMEVNR